MKKTIVALGISWLLISDIAPVSGQGTDLNRPLMMAVFVRAEWDEPSKAMQSIYDGLRNRFDEDPILFVELDITNTTERHQAKMLAAALEVDSVIGEMKEKVGTIQFILGPVEWEIVSALPGPMEFARASQALEKALTAPPN